MFYITYLGFLIRIPCVHCNTPYRMAGIVLIITYGIRTLCEIWNLFFSFHHYGLLASEISILKNSVSEYRFFNKVAPDLNRTSSLTISNFILAIMFTVTLAFIMLLTLWIGQNLCEDSCPRIFSAYQFLLTALYILEVCIVIAEGINMYLKRAMGIEGVEKIIETVCTKDEDEVFDEDEDAVEPLNPYSENDDDFEQDISEGDNDDELIALRQSQPSTVEAQEGEK